MATIIKSKPRDPALVDDYLRELANRGEVYMGHDLPPDLEYGEPGECFANCLLAALGSNGKYQYCEGLGFFNDEVYAHSWVTNGEHAYDLTWRIVDNKTQKERAIHTYYKGVALDTEACKRFILSTHRAGVVSNRELRPRLYKEVLKASNLL